MTTTRRDRAASDELLRRVVQSLPGATFELERFVGLIGVEVTDRIPTAAVTCGARSRLLLNPEFVAAYCRTDEHLFMLVMHELWHVLLGHTRLHPRPTPAHNIAFDAMINSGLAHQFPGREYRGFFESVYSAEQFPERLLRPPAGWPHRPVYSGPGPSGTERVMQTLYPPTRRPPTAYGGDVLALLDGVAVDGVQLLGDHDADDADYASVADGPRTGPALREMVGEWPGGPPGGPGQAAGDLRPWILDPPRPRSVPKEFEAVLRRAADRQRGDRRVHTGSDRVAVVSVLPSRHDRHHVARTRLGLPSLLRRPVLDVPTRQQERAACVYLDVSGSMADLLPLLLPPLVRAVTSGSVTLWQFSTGVVPLSLTDLRAGRLETTGGTAIGPVLAHAVESGTTRSIVVLTDGYVEMPDTQVLAALAAQDITVEAVVPASHAAWPLSEFATVTVLPDLAECAR